MVVTRSAARMKQNQLVTLSDQNIVAESSRTKEPPAPKENIKKIPAARQCGNVAANLLEEQASNEINEEGSSAPKKNIKKIPAARQCGNVAANLLEAQESNENEKTGTKKKVEKLPSSKMSSTSPEAATKDNANPNMKPSLKKSTKKQKSQKAGKDKIENEAK
ncbi:uncharacterized protein LOC6728650 isoform X5 [Drosophila simulans]|uniref:uncharacterized protein LOC6728650 isoform X5 n=1 Tax=Drosophila simulans TaxID=7240 RepID=UPI00078ADE69|nr:uncharacterized protein LOC6728650 isoform X5 [Drosophila simulans]KMZ04432.1 uncharacterized protein Dsimw501_GD18689, isoform D [Drosophila simulans]